MKTLLEIVLLLAVASGAQAQVLRDPTRPPAARAEAIAAGQDAPSSRLQSVLLSSARKVAIIDGETVALGGRLGDAVLISLSETEAVLQRGPEIERLRLTPSINKKRSAVRLDAPPTASGDGGIK